MGPLELIENIRAGRDPRRAEEELYLIVRENVLRHLRPQTVKRIQSRLDLEDVLQEVILRVLTSLDRFEPAGEGPFFAWVYRIARNVIADQAKRRSAAAVHFGTSRDGGPLRESAIPAGGRRAESDLQRRDWIESILRQLKEREAEVVRLHWLKGQSFAEIATLWKKNEAAVKRYYSHPWARFKGVARRKEAR